MRATALACGTLLVASISALVVGGEATPTVRLSTGAAAGSQGDVGAAAPSTSTTVEAAEPTTTVQPTQTKTTVTLAPDPTGRGCPCYPNGEPMGGMAFPRPVITGRIMEASGAGVPDLCVVVDWHTGRSETLVTDATGSYRYEFPEGIPGYGWVVVTDCRATVPAWATRSRLFDLINRGDTATVDVVVQRGAQIAGTALDVEGEPVPGACIEMAVEEVRGEHIVLTAATDDLGHFRFDNVPPGVRRLDARRPCAGDTRTGMGKEEVSLGEGATVPVTVTMLLVGQTPPPGWMESYYG
jgi:hypothetical protein